MAKRATPEARRVNGDSPPREDLFRFVSATPSLDTVRDGESEQATLVGELAVFNEWTEVDSMFEGHFMERLAPGSFDETIAQDAESMRPLFQHGRDAYIGMKPLGPIQKLEANTKRVRYEVPLLDTQYNAELEPGLRAGLYGSSFRFAIDSEEFNRAPERSAYNPDGIPERTITKLRMREFGPVTFPQYKGTSAGVRSITDEMMGLSREDGVDESRERVAVELPPVDASNEEVPKSVRSTRRRSNPKPEEPQVSDQAEGTPVSDLAYEDRLLRCDDIRERLADIDQSYEGRALPEVVEREFNELRQELPQHEAIIASVDRRRDQLAALHVGENAGTAARADEGEANPAFHTRGSSSQQMRADVWDLTSIRSMTDEGRDREYRERTRRVIDQAFFPHPEADQARCKEHLSRLLARFEADDQNPELASGNLERYARRLLSTGSPAYLRTFQRGLRGLPLSPENFRALSLTGAGGGFAVPYTLDPTIIPTSNSSVNPWRAVARIESITTDAWKGVASAGVTATRALEAAESTDNSPTLSQPSVDAERVHVFIPFSFEIGQDWGSLQSEMASIIQDAKDDEEAASFAIGTGTSPAAQGIVTALAADSSAIVTLGGSGAFAIADLFSVEQALGARFRVRAQWVMNRGIMNLARQFDTAGGSGVWLDGLSPGLQNQVPMPGNTGARLLGYPVNESTSMSSVKTSGTYPLIFGDFRYFLIIDRIGMNLDLIPHLFGASNRPTGQRGLYAFWRNNCKVLSTAAFKLAKTG